MTSIQRIWFRKGVRVLLAALLAFVIIGGFIWPLVSIQLRLARNGKIAQQFVESLEARFPGTGFRGGASYEREVIYIGVMNHLDEAEQQEVERWLRKQKIEQKVAPQIRLRFMNDDPDREIIFQ